MAQIYGEVILNDLNRLRSHPSLNDDPSLCATHTLLVMLASSTSGDQHIFYRYDVQTTTPSGLGTSENGW